MIQSKPVNYVLDADIKGFFDHMDHEWIIRFIESKIKDPNITRLVRRMLKDGRDNSEVKQNPDRLLPLLWHHRQYTKYQEIQI